MSTDYGSDTIKSISVLESMRTKAGMWGFQLGSTQGNIIQIREIVDNSVDEALDPKRVYPIYVTFFVSRDKKNYQVLVQDFGRGIPVEKLADCFIKEFTSGKYEGRYGGSAGQIGTFGVGSKASAALSKKFIAFTNRAEGFGYLSLSKGKVLDHKTFKSPANKDKATFGTTVLLQPDDDLLTSTPEMFGKPSTELDPNGFDKFLERMSYYNLFRNNICLEIGIVDGMLKPAELDGSDPKKLWAFLTNLKNFKITPAFKSDLETTPRSYVIKKFNLKEPIWELGALHKESSGMDDPLAYDLDIFVDEKSAKGNCGTIGAVNGTPISHQDSSHFVVLQTVLKDQLDEFIDDADARAYFEAKYRIPISGCISVGWVGAEFIGQDKSRFENRAFAEAYRAHLRKTFRKITEEKGQAIWDTLWDFIKENFDSEYSKYSRRSLGLGKNTKNLTYELLRSGSFFNCISDNSEITELFITEGDSAAGRVSTERDETTQAMYVLGGKPANGIRIRDRSKLEKNAIISDLIKILNVDPTAKDLSKMRFKRILIMTDADADGYHITALLIGIFYRINPLILEEGRVLITNPPLYAMKFDKKTVYMRDENALRDVRTTWYRTLFDIDISTDNGKTAHHLNSSHIYNESQLPDGTKIHNLNKNHDEFRNLCMVTDYIGTVVEHQADLLNIDAGLLEQLLHCVDALKENAVDTKKIKETMLECSDVIWDKGNNLLILVDTQGVELRVPLVGLHAALKGVILPVYERAHWRDFNMFISTKYTDKFRGQPCTFMMLYQIFKDIGDICKIQRFKGLGEMTKEAIALTCVNKSTRCFTVIRGLGDVDMMYKMLDTDTEARKKLVNSNYLE